ncbi:MAG: hypothetical protein ACK56D_13250 [Planctomycetota bacterium]
MRRKKKNSTPRKPRRRPNRPANAPLNFQLLEKRNLLASLTVEADLVIASVEVIEEAEAPLAIEESLNDEAAEVGPIPDQVLPPDTDLPGETNSGGETAPSDSTDETAGPTEIDPPTNSDASGDSPVGDEEPADGEVPPSAGDDSAPPSPPAELPLPPDVLPPEVLPPAGGEEADTEEQNGSGPAPPQNGSSDQDGDGGGGAVAPSEPADDSAPPTPPAELPSLPDVLPPDVLPPAGGGEADSEEQEGSTQSDAGNVSPDDETDDAEEPPVREPEEDGALPDDGSMGPTDSDQKELAGDDQFPEEIDGNATEEAEQAVNDQGDQTGVLGLLWYREKVNLTGIFDRAATPQPEVPLSDLDFQLALEKSPILKLLGLLDELASTENSNAESSPSFEPEVLDSAFAQRATLS